MDFILQLKLIADAGLLVLIWLVQLVIYPGFKYYEQSDLKRWHSDYTGRITWVVLPLMLSQLVLSCWLAYNSDWDFLYMLNSILVIFTWVSTFITFVPLHHKIDVENENLIVYVQKLIGYNWIRTFLWTIIFLLTLFTVIK